MRDNKKRRCALVLSGALWVSINAWAAGDGPVEHRYPLAEQGYLVLQVPKDWRDRVSWRHLLMPPTIIFAPASGEPFQVLVTPIWPSNAADKPKLDELKRDVAAAAEKAKSQAAEKTLPLVAVKGGTTSGYFFAATDRAPKADEFKYIVQGMLGLEQLRVSFTVLTNEGRKSVPAEALAMLREARLEPAGARRGATPDAPRLPERAALRALFEAGKFAELDADLRAVQDAYRRGLIEEEQAARAFGFLKTHDPERRARFDRWVAEQPASYAARLLRGDYLVGLAYLARGSAVAKRTSRAQFKEMDALLAAALEDLGAALKLDPYPVLAAAPIVDAAQAIGADEQAAAAAAAALALDSGAYYVRHAYLANLQPQWGGSLEQMAAALEHWQRWLDERKWRQLARMLEDAKWRAALAPAAKLYEEKRYPEAIALYTKAIDTTPVARAYAMRGASFAQLGEHVKAIADFDQALDLDPFGECCSGVRSNRARSFLRIGQVDKGIADLLVAAENDDAFAARELAVIYAFGKYGRKPDYPAAVRWCDRAAKQGDGL
ncbi:MAG TPA: DUF4034 domain-containing protein, partial [Burkholderiales bacterium]|nr:DUF4034 domain-containing protein [Burkholderiales bacterium]